MEAEKAPAEPQERVLRICKSQSKVVLPYTTAQLEKILASSDKYKTLCEVIDGEYTVPLRRYKIGFVARFREGYALMRKREKSSLWDAIDLAFELMFTKYLHPAVVAACKNLDELDVYLDCMNTSEPEAFPFFRIECE